MDYLLQQCRTLWCSTNYTRVTRWWKYILTTMHVVHHAPYPNHTYCGEQHAGQPMGPHWLMMDFDGWGMGFFFSKSAAMEGMAVDDQKDVGQGEHTRTLNPNENIRANLENKSNGLYWSEKKSIGTTHPHQRIIHARSWKRHKFGG